MILVLLQSKTFFLIIIKVSVVSMILSTSFIHILSDAFENIISPCLNDSVWGDFPFKGFIAMIVECASMDEVI